MICIVYEQQTSPTINLSIKNGGSWIKPKDIWIKNGGSWAKAKGVWIKNGGSWIKQ
jgi:hypothetical protein